MAFTKNKYCLPIDSNKITRTAYNESPAHKGMLKHAVDFITPIGTPVKASADGIVVDIKDDSNIGSNSKKLYCFGNFITIKHEHDEYSEYEHLKKGSMRVKIGQRVKRGQVIALSGATGYLAHLGPHLHFSVGKYVDMKTLKIRWNKR